MTEKDRQLLTEWGGECWHKLNWRVASYCLRTFTTWEDFGWLVDKAKEKGLWEYFVNWLEVESLAPIHDVLIDKVKLPEKVVEFLNMNKGKWSC